MTENILSNKLALSLLDNTPETPVEDSDISSDWLTDYQIMNKPQSSSTPYNQLTFTVSKPSDTSQVTPFGNQQSKATSPPTAGRKFKYCPTPDCDGSGNTRGKFKSHSSALYCPTAKAFVFNLITENKQLKQKILELEAEKVIQALFLFIMKFL